MNAVVLLDSASGSLARGSCEAAEVDELHQVQVQLAKVTSDVEHIKADVADIKVGLRNLAGRVDAVETRLYGFETQVAEKFGVLKVWMLSLHVAQAASLLLVMAKGFKWF